MKINSILFNGCSVTYGEELPEPENERFSKLICNDLGAEEINIAMCGSSNEAIFRTTVEYIASSKNITPDLVVIVWSGVDRFEAWHPTIKDPHSKVLYNVSPARIDKIYKKNKRVGQAYSMFYEYIMNVRTSIFKTLSMMYFLQEYLKSKKIPYLFYQFAEHTGSTIDILYNDTHNRGESTDGMRELIIQKYNQLEAQSIFGADIHSKDYTNTPRYWGDINHDLAPHGHPLHKTQRFVSNLIISKLKELYDIRI